jgi:Bacterial Ig-like domain
MKILICSMPLMLLITIFGCKETPVTNNYYYYSTDSLSDPNIKPKVIFTNPANGAVGPFINDDANTYPNSPQIIIQFNKLMNVLNVNGSNSSIRLTTTNASYPLTLINDNYPSNSSNILTFSITYKYLTNTVYTVTVDTTLFDVDGNRLSSPYVFSYTPEPQFRVYSGSPSSNDYPDGINPGSVGNFTVDLNSKIDTTFFSNIQIFPSIRGEWVINPPWNYTTDSTRGYFIFTDTLQFDTKYTISVAAGAKDVNGLLMKAPYQFSFATQPFEAYNTGWSSYSGNGGFAVIGNIYFAFNGYIDTSSVRSSISISPSLSFNLSFSIGSGGYQGVDVMPNVDQMERNTTYTVTINITARSINGVHLKNPYSYSVITGM